MALGTAVDILLWRVSVDFCGRERWVACPCAVSLRLESQREGFCFSRIIFLHVILSSAEAFLSAFMGRPGYPGYSVRTALGLRTLHDSLFYWAPLQWPPLHQGTSKRSENRKQKTRPSARPSVRPSARPSVQQTRFMSSLDKVHIKFRQGLYQV